MIRWLVLLVFLGPVAHAQEECPKADIIREYEFAVSKEFSWLVLSQTPAGTVQNKVHFCQLDKNLETLRSTFTLDYSRLGSAQIVKFKNAITQTYAILTFRDGAHGYTIYVVDPLTKTAPVLWKLQSSREVQLSYKVNNKTVEPSFSYNAPIKVEVIDQLDVRYSDNDVPKTTSWKPQTP